MLKHPYISIQCEDGSVSYGGNQSWLPTPAERSFGCGFIAAADILRYLKEREKLNSRESDSEKSDSEKPDSGKADSEKLDSEKLDSEEMRFERVNSGKTSLTKKQYLEDMLLLSGDFPVRGKLGITGFGLARRMNRLFRREGLPYRAKWSIGKKRLLRRLSEMLDADIPVLLSAGPGFFHKEGRLALYTSEGGGFRKTNSMRDHYVTVTGRIRMKVAAGNALESAENCAAENAVAGLSEEETLYRISSWGGEYYIREREYLDYAAQYDNFLFSNILYIRRTE